MSIFQCVPLFSDVSQLIAGLELQYDKRWLDVPLYILDDQWPMNRERNLDLLEIVKKRFGATVVTAPENLGVHHGFNYLTSKMPLADGDRILLCAPDTVPVREGWDSAEIDALDTYEDIAYVGLPGFDTFDPKHSNVAYWEKRYFQFHQRELANPQYIDEILMVPSSPACIHSSAWKWDFLKKVGGFSEPTSHYGHLETTMFSKARSLGMNHGYLAKFFEDFRLESYHDDSYRVWKTAHAACAPGEIPFKGNFAEWAKVPFYERGKYGPRQL